MFGAGWGHRVKEVRAAALAMAKSRTGNKENVTMSPGKGVAPVNRKAQQASVGGIAAAGAAAAHRRISLACGWPSSSQWPPQPSCWQPPPGGGGADGNGINRNADMKLDWKDLAQTVIGLGAPSLGMALGRPLGGVAGKILADALGVVDGNARPMSAR